jgi:CheY-like chemotaxis protein
VLVVDDDDDIRETVADALTDCGYVVKSSADGRAALVEMRASIPCLVLLDLMMPVLDGWEVVRAMEADPALAGIPVCVISALVSNRAPPHATRVLQKPARLATLVTLIETHCTTNATA